MNCLLLGCRKKQHKKDCRYLKCSNNTAKITLSFAKSAIRIMFGEQKVRPTALHATRTHF